MPEDDTQNKCSSVKSELLFSYLAWSWVVVIRKHLTGTLCFFARSMKGFLASLSTWVLSTTTLFPDMRPWSANLMVFSFPPVLSLLATTTPSFSRLAANTDLPDPCLQVLHLTKCDPEKWHTWIPTIRVRDGWGVVKVVEGSMRTGQETGGWKEGSLYLEVGERPRNSSSGVRNVIFRFKANSRSLQEKSFFFPAAHFVVEFFSLWRYLKLLIWNIQLQFFLLFQPVCQPASLPAASPT